MGKINGISQFHGLLELVHKLRPSRVVPHNLYEPTKAKPDASRSSMANEGVKPLEVRTSDLTWSK